VHKKKRVQEERTIFHDEEHLSHINTQKKASNFIKIQLIFEISNLNFKFDYLVYVTVFSSRILRLCSSPKTLHFLLALPSLGAM